MSAFKKTLLYLGLGPDEEYEFGQGLEPEPDSTDARVGGPVSTAGPTPSGPTVRAVPIPAEGADSFDGPGEFSSGGASAGDFSASGSSPDTVRRIAPVAQPARVSGSPAVRALPIQKSAKPSTVAPISFNDAQDVADRFMDSEAVIVNLQNVDRELSRRIIDFASGLCYGLGGQMERVANNVYLLTPDDVEITEADRRGLLD